MYWFTSGGVLIYLSRCRWWSFIFMAVTKWTFTDTLFYSVTFWSESLFSYFLQFTLNLFYITALWEIDHDFPLVKGIISPRECTVIIKMKVIVKFSLENQRLKRVVVHVNSIDRLTQEKYIKAAEQHVKKFVSV